MHSAKLNDSGFTSIILIIIVVVVVVVVIMSSIDRSSSVISSFYSANIRTTCQLRQPRRSVGYDVSRVFVVHATLCDIVTDVQGRVCMLVGRVNFITSQVDARSIDQS